MEKGVATLAASRSFEARCRVVLWKFKYAGRKSGYLWQWDSAPAILSVLFNER